MDLIELLSLCVSKNASDLHISSWVKPMIRIDGELQSCTDKTTTTEDIYQLLQRIMSKEQLGELSSQLECDFAINMHQLDSRFRVNAFTQDRGVAVAFRTIPQHICSLDSLNTPEIFKHIITKAHGLIIVTGPTGSGKSTTLAAMIDYLNHCKKGHVISIEDPIEFIHKSDQCLINQREVHRDTKSFNRELRSALRVDPDYILIGKMRDIETIRLALTAAETGHLVFATLHTSSAPKTIDRIINVFPAQEQTLIRTMLSESLQAIIAQRLVRKQVSGRVAAHEILIANTVIRNLIRENKIPQIYNVLQTNQQIGMSTLQQSLSKLAQQGVISHEEMDKHLN